MAGTAFPPRSSWGTKYFEYASKTHAGNALAYISGVSGKRILVTAFQFSCAAGGASMRIRWGGSNNVFQTGVLVAPNVHVEDEDGLFILPAGENLAVYDSETGTAFGTFQYYLVD